MRARNIKPGFFKNESLAECSPLARIFFEGLWCFADKKGICEYRPKKMKIEILPYDNINPEELITELIKYNFVRIYEVNGNKYLKVLNFTKHQHPHHTEKDSELPDYNSELPVIYPLSNGYNPSDSLIPDSLIPDISNFAQSYENNVAHEQEKINIFTYLLLNDKTKFLVTEEMIEEMSELYPAVNLRLEYKKMKKWLEDNPKKRKTRNGIKRFCTTWLQKEQDKYHCNMQQSKKPSLAIHNSEFTDLSRGHPRVTTYTPDSEEQKNE